MLKVLLPLAILGTGCMDLSGGQHDSDAYDPGGGAWTGGTNPTPPARGTFSVHSELAITAEQLLPNSGEQLVLTLRDFSTEPSATLFDLADEAGVPAIGTLRSALPDVVEDKLTGYLDAEIAKATLGGVPITTFAATIVGYAAQSLTTMQIDSTMSLDTLTHELDAIALTVGGETMEIPLDTLPREVRTDTFQLSTLSWNSQVLIGDHEFCLQLGSYAWTAIDNAIESNFGGSLRDLLGAAVDCPAIAQRVATKCVLGQCVGHAADLTEICERGLDEVVDQARAQVESFNITALHLAEGEATLRGSRPDGTFSQLDAGMWTGELDLGQGLRPATGTFTATRQN